MEENHREYPNKILEVQRTVSEGELVAVHSRIRMSAADNGMAVIHLFRFQDGKIAEMWSVGQQVAEESPNVNGMF
jgi:predicted SnoaL-like aldol condensation-catalyzing enzyme